LIRCRIVRSDEFTFYPTLSHQESTLADLVRVAGARWIIQACFEAAKAETGLDQHEVRSWTGWHRHVTFAILAQANLAVVRRAVVGGRGESRSRGRSSAHHRAGTAPAAGMGATA
jgi:SRSO17 transposase